MTVVCIAWQSAKAERRFKQNACRKADINDDEDRREPTPGSSK
jgi:hypothetical protein